MMAARLRYRSLEWIDVARPVGLVKERAANEKGESITWETGERSRGAGCCHNLRRRGRHRVGCAVRAVWWQRDKLRACAWRNCGAVRFGWFCFP
jgi:hypothetical protein